MNDSPMDVTGWRCATCATEVAVETAMPFRCPAATADDPRHVLQIVSRRSDGQRRRDGHDAATQAGAARLDEQTFVANDHRLAWAAFAETNGLGWAERTALVTSLDEAVRRVAGVGFEPTPFVRSTVLSDHLGMSSAGGVWVKDETGGVAGSQKARFLFSILLHLRTLEELGRLPVRPSLAIASCGNAALAAATLAKAAAWPIDVFVPTWMGDGFGDRLDELGANVHRCERREADPPGDPAMHRFRDAVAAGKIPFTVQGPENALCLDGGRTLGWEICDQAALLDIGPIDRVFVQVGGGAFAAAVGAAMNDSCGPAPLHAVQTEGCAPFERAWRRAAGNDHPAADWAELMTVWDHPASLADGILDDETYDWIGVLDAVRSSGGQPVIAPEVAVVEAHTLAADAGFDASPTGSAGLAGLLAMREQIGRDERVVIVMSGVTR